MLNRRTVLTSAAAAGLPLALPEFALAQARKDTMVIAMTLEPPGLDPTTGAASAIAEITHYNIYETLTKINADGKVTPPTATRTSSPAASASGSGSPAPSPCARNSSWPTSRCRPWTSPSRRRW